jgi:hypothetical protein
LRHFPSHYTFTPLHNNDLVCNFNTHCMYSKPEFIKSFLVSPLSAVRFMDVGFPDGNHSFIPIWFYCFVTFFQMATFLSLFPDGNHGFIPYGSTFLSLFSRWQLFCHFFQMATTVLSHMVLLFCQIMPELFSQWSHLGLESYVYTVKSCLQQQYWFHCLCYYNQVVVITVV